MARDLSELLAEAAASPAPPPDLGAAWRSGRRRARLRTAGLGVGAALVLGVLAGVGEAALRPDVRFTAPGPTSEPVPPAVRVPVGPSGEAGVRCWELGSGWVYTESVEPDGTISGNAVGAPPMSSAPGAAIPNPEAQSPDGTTLEDNGWSTEDRRLLTKAMAGVEAMRAAGATGTDGELESRRAVLRDRLEGMQRCASIDADVDGRVVPVPPAPARAAVTGTLLRLGDCLVLERDDGLTAAVDVDGLRADVDAGSLLDEAGAVVAHEGALIQARGQVAEAEVPGCPSVEVLITEPLDASGEPIGGVSLVALPTG